MVKASFLSHQNISTSKPNMALARCACGDSLAFVAHVFPGNASKRWNSVRSANELKCSQLFSFPTNGTRLVQLALEVRFTDKYVQ